VLLTFIWAPEAGRLLGATPDGRKTGVPVAHSVTPQSSSMTKGITAAINSCTSLPFELFSGGASAMWDLDPSIVSHEIVESLFTTFFEQGGHIFQGNVTDVEALIRAQSEPEKYPHLIVRVGGYSSRFETKAEMPVTMMRLNMVKGLGPVMQIAEGWTVSIPDEVTDKLWKRTDYTWPCTWFAPRVTGKGAFKTAYDVMNNWGANHGAISYGHIGADLITLCSMLRIPVCMHNVDEKDVYRPASWNAFGMDKEGQDYRACQAYGPLYKNIK
jgi:L-fucose isomerase-like protein